jgi:hypothetical protein
MTEIATGEAPAEPVPVPPAPKAAEVEAAAGPAEPDTEADTPAAAHEVAFPVGSTSQLILDCFLDFDEGDQLSMAKIKAALPHTDPNTIEGAVHRLHKKGRLLRVSAGVYRLGAERPPEPLKPPEPAPLPEPKPREAALQRARERKQEARRRDRDAALARQAEADAALRDQLTAATGGNFTPDLLTADLAPIRAALQLVPLDVILGAVRNKTDKILCPANEPLTRWGEPRILKAIAERYCKHVLVDRLVAEWTRAAKVTGKPAERAEASAAVELPPEDESAPAPSDGALADELGLSPEGDVQAGALGFDAEISGIDPDATTGAATSLDIIDSMGRPPAADRQSILSRFRRAPAPSVQPLQQPQSPRPATPQPRPTERPWFAGERQAQQPQELGPDAIDELVQGWRAGNLAWPRRLLGEPPGHPGCRLSREDLRRNGL